MSAYLETLNEALNSLSLAYQEALAEVPPPIRTEHWTKTRGSFGANPGEAWEEVYYKTQNVDYLILKEMIEAKIKLEAAVNLKTPKEQQS